MTDQKPDRRALTSAANLRKGGGRPRKLPGYRIYSLAVPPDLYEWMRDRGPEEVRAALLKWRIETLIV